MAHSKRDIINEERAKRAEGVGADPGIEVGGTTHGELQQRVVGLLHEGGSGVVVMHPDGEQSTVTLTEGEDFTVVHNSEQLTILADLERLIHDTGAVIAMAKAMRSEDESLYRQDVDWDMVGCGHAERWIDDGGNLGWRVGINFADPSAVKFLAYIASKLGTMGWENVIAEAWGG